jgi:acetyl-CoA C-acetyltransferase
MPPRHGDDLVIVGAARTPVGRFLGGLAPLTATRLGSAAIEAAVARARIAPGDVDEVIMGHVIAAGTGQAPARQAALGAGLPASVPCAAVNKVCGSGLYAVTLAARSVRTGDARIAVAGGMESMSNAPYFVTGARQGLRFGHQQLTDAMILDGLWDPYNDFHMASAGELCARECGISRAAQDAFAIESYRRSRDAQRRGAFDAEIVPVPVPQRRGEPVLVKDDEEPANADLDKLPSLKPAFEEGGTITAGNASTLNDGAAAVVVTTRAEAARRGLRIVARILGWGGVAQAPEWFTTAPVPAILRTLDRLGMATKDIDLYEINEAFAVVALVVMEKAGLAADKVNVNGGAVSLGHPIGASGARILVTLLGALEARGLTTGVASLCIGGGEAWALVVERE